jgi:hypothetical protein
MEIYFLTNQSDEEISLSPSFRVQGLKPQLWDAMTGDIRPLSEFSEKNGRITVPIKMKANQSWFVVFSNDKIDNSKIYKENFPTPSIVQTLKNPWKVDFKNKQIGPKESVLFPSLTNWIENSDEKIKFYSGTAVYASTFNFSDKKVTNDIFINLGNVGVMASVKVNGIELGTTWIAPYQINVTKAIKNGENTVEIEVVNVWRNRLTGDKTLPKEERTTWLMTDKTTPEEALIPSGLLGPITIETIK